MVKAISPSLLALVVVAATSFVSASSLVRATEEHEQHGSSPPHRASCSADPAVDDILAGVDLVADESCTSGALGCLGTSCHYCQRWDSPFSSPLPQCKTLEDASTSQTCADVHGLKDQSLGLTMENDASCADASVGCIRSGCRICRVRDTPKSIAFKVCTGNESPTPSTPIVKKTLAEAMSGQEAVAEKGSDVWLLGIGGAGCAVLAIGGMIFAAKRAARDSTSPDIITPSNSIAYQRASVFHI